MEVRAFSSSSEIFLAGTLLRLACRTSDVTWSELSAKGLCKMVYRAPKSLTENVLLNFLGKMLSEWPEWMQQTYATLQETLRNAAQQVPANVDADERQLAKVQKQLDRLVDALAEGSQQSQSIVSRVKQLESESETLQQRIAAARKLLSQPIELPDEKWMRSQIQNLTEMLRAEPGPAALLLREIIGKITIHEIIPPGKKKGYGRMSFTLSGGKIIKKLVTSVPATLVPLNGTSISPEIQLDLGGPTRCDRSAPEIDAMRKNGLGWRQIGRVTGLGHANASTAWTRWRNAQPGTA